MFEVVALYLANSSRAGSVTSMMDLVVDLAPQDGSVYHIGSGVDLVKSDMCVVTRTSPSYKVGNGNDALSVEVKSGE